MFSSQPPHPLPQKAPLALENQFKPCSSLLLSWLVQEHESLLCITRNRVLKLQLFTGCPGQNSSVVKLHDCMLVRNEFMSDIIA